MGGSLSVGNTVLGQSVIGKKYSTKIPFYYNRFSHDDKAYLYAYPCSAGCIDHFKMTPFIFTVKDAIRSYHGVSLDLVIQLDDNDTLPPIPIVIHVQPYQNSVQQCFTIYWKGNDIDFNRDIVMNTELLNLV